MDNLNSQKQNALTLALISVYLLALVWLILFKLQLSLPQQTAMRVINLVPFAGSFNDNGALLMAEISTNILSFVPLGIYLSMLKRSCPFLKKLFPAICLALSFKIIQFSLMIGRADVTDVLNNAIGTAIGIGFYALLSKLLKGRENKVINTFALTFTILASIIIILLLLTNHWVVIKYTNP